MVSESVFVYLSGRWFFFSYFILFCLGRVWRVMAGRTDWMEGYFDTHFHCPFSLFHIFF